MFNFMNNKQPMPFGGPMPQSPLGGLSANNKRPMPFGPGLDLATPPGIGGGPMQTGFGAPMYGGSLLGQFSGGGAPGGYLPPPAGVPFARSPFTSFGSPFGLGLGFWNSGFGIGPQFPENLWNRPAQEQSPQSPVAPPPQTNAGDAGGSWDDFLRAYKGHPGYLGPGSEVESREPTFGMYQNWLSNPSNSYGWRPRS